jgi:hypothetical protein
LKETGTNILVNYLGTPINLQGFGRKINIGGGGETKYLGFEDFVTGSSGGGPPRPLTDKIPDSRASDILLAVVADNFPRADRDSPHCDVALPVHRCDTRLRFLGDSRFCFPSETSLKIFRSLTSRSRMGWTYRFL